MTSVLAVQLADEAPSPLTPLEIDSVTVRVADPAMQAVYRRLRAIAVDRVPVLIHGETGTGKEIAARAIHQLSSRRAGPLIPVNCAALPAGLIESELFGHERGAFSGATSKKLGLFEVAAGGTLFLDEIGELPLELQARLLRFLDDRGVRRVGGLTPKAIDARIVAATNRDLLEEVHCGRFREDLYFRLNVASVRIPPLRERLADIRMLAGDLLGAACAERGRSPLSVSNRAMHALVAHPWPGNVRELKHLMEVLAVTVTASQIDVHHLTEAGFPFSTLRPPRQPEDVPASSDAPRTSLAGQVAAFERTKMVEALEATGWIQLRAARLLGVPRRTFTTKMARYRIRSPRS